MEYTLRKPEWNNDEPPVEKEESDDESEDEDVLDFLFWRNREILVPIAIERQAKAEEVEPFKRDPSTDAIVLETAEDKNLCINVLSKCLKYLQSVDIERVKAIQTGVERKEGQLHITPRPTSEEERELLDLFVTNIHLASEFTRIWSQKGSEIKKLFKVYLEKGIFEIFLTIWKAKPFWINFGAFQNLGLFYYAYCNVLNILTSITYISKGACKLATETGIDKRNVGKVGVIQAILHDLNRPLCQIVEEKNPLQQDLIRDYHMLLTNIVQRHSKAKEQIRNAGGIDTLKATLRNSRFCSFLFSLINTCINV